MSWRISPCRTKRKAPSTREWLGWREPGNHAKKTFKKTSVSGEMVGEMLVFMWILWMVNRFSGWWMYLARWSNTTPVDSWTVQQCQTKTICRWKDLFSAQCGRKIVSVGWLNHSSLRGIWGWFESIQNYHTAPPKKMDGLGSYKWPAFVDPLRPHFLVTSQLVDGVWFNPFHGDSCISFGWFFGTCFIH